MLVHLKVPGCNIGHHYFEYRYCRMGGKADAMNPRNNENFEKDVTQGTS